MAMDIFLKIEGIEGEAKDKAHPKEIQLLSWAWDMFQSGYAHSGGGLGAGKVQVKDMRFTKEIDKSTAAIMLHCCNGKHIPSALLTVRKSGGEEPVEYLKIKLQDILVSSYGNSGHATQDDKVTEEFTFNFAKYVTTYTEQTEEGGKGAVVSQGWDLKTNAKHA